MAYASLLQYGMQSPIEFGMLQRYDSMDPSTWTDSQKGAYLKWAEAEQVPPNVWLDPRMGSDFVRTTNDAGGDPWRVTEEWEGRREVNDLLAEYDRGDLMREIEFTDDGASTVDLRLLMMDPGEEASTVDVGRMSDFPGEEHTQKVEYEAGEKTDIAEAGWGDRVEIPELPSEVVGIKPFKSTTSGARPFEMGAETRGVNNIKEFGSPRPPSIELEKLKVALSDEELAPILEDSFEGFLPTGEGMFDLGGIMTSLRGVAVNIGVVQPILDYIKTNWGVPGEVINMGVQIVGGAQMLFAMNPIDWAGIGLMQLGTEAIKQQERAKENNYSGDVDTTRLMMVKDNNVWYPGVLANRTKDPGSAAGTIEIRYGEPDDFFLNFEDGSYKGHFTNQKNRQFRFEDDEWTGEKSTHEWAESHDPLRQFYFLSEDQQKEIFNSYGTSEYSWDTIPESDSNYTPFMKKYTDLAASMDFIQNKERTTDDPSSFLVAESKGLRYWAQNDLQEMQRFGTDSTWLNPTGGVGIARSDEQFGAGTRFDGKAGYGAVGMNDFVTEVLPRQMVKLTNSREHAAQSIGMSASLYIDGAKSLPAAKTFDELQAQYTAIEAYTDRNEAQKTYLRSKAATRYEMNFAGDMGFGSNLYDTLVNDDPAQSRNLLPTHFTGFGVQGTFFKDIPAWMNTTQEGPHALENVFPTWLKIDDWQREKVSGNIGSDQMNASQSIDLFVGQETRNQWDQGELKTVSGTGPDDPNWSFEGPEELIRQAGLKTRAEWVAQEKNRIATFKNMTPPPPEVEEEEEVPTEFIDPRDTPQERLRRSTQVYHGEGETRVKGTKRKIPESGGFEAAYQTKQRAQYLREIHGGPTPKDTRAAQVAYWEQVTIDANKVREDKEAAKQAETARIAAPRAEKLASTHWLFGDEQGTEITHEGFKSQAFDITFDPSYVGEHSYPAIVESILFGDANWVPKGEPLSEENIPSWWVTDDPDIFRPLLERIDREDDPAMKQRANYIHNLVGKKDSLVYTARFHPTANMDTAELGKHLAVLTVSFLTTGAHLTSTT